MATVRKTKCPYCDIYFYRDQEEHTLIKNRYWHKKCYEEFQEKQNVSVKAITELENYICELFSLDHVSARVKKQIKDMTDVNSYSYSGILSTLRYWYEIKGGDRKKANGGIGIVPFVYEDARKYYEGIYNAQQSNKGVVLNPSEGESKKVTIKSPRNKGFRFKTIDIDLLEERYHKDNADE